MNAVVFDIGGTNVKYGLYRMQGKAKNSKESLGHSRLSFVQSLAAGERQLLYLGTFPTEGHKGKDRLLHRIRATASSLPDLDAISLCSRGQIDPDRKLLLHDRDDIIKGYTGTDFNRAFASLQLPLFTENDAKAAGLAEAACFQDQEIDLSSKAASPASSSFRPHITVYMCFGSGIGGSVFFDGRLIRGFSQSAGEFGKMPLQVDFPLRYEDRYSVSALIDDCRAFCPAIKDGRKLAALLFAHPGAASSAPMSPDRALNISVTRSSANLIDSERRRKIEKIYRNWLLGVSSGILSIIYALDPERLILGGGFLESPPVFDDIRRSVLSRMETGFQAELFPCRFGNKAGLIGAGLLAEKGLGLF